MAVFDSIIGETIAIRGFAGDKIEAYLSRPMGNGPYPGVVVIHHLPGWDRATREIVRRFACEGYLSICPNLHYRFNPEDPEDAAVRAREAGGDPDDQVIGDIAASVAYLRDHPLSNGKVGVIGYCSGGRQAFLAACRLQLDAAVDCYGGFVARSAPEGAPLKMQPVLNEASGISCPILGLFGKEDQFPSPEEVGEIEAELKRLGKTYEFYSYEGAGHAFFHVDRDSYRPAAALDGWRRIFDFFGKYLAG